MATVARHIDERAWLEERKKGIGGSEVAAIFGEHPFLTAQELWERKTGRAGEVDVTPAMERGRVLEEIAAERYVQETGRRVRRMPMRRHREYPFLLASVDRQVLAGDDHPTAALEIKVPGYHVFQEVRRQGLRPYMILQGQHEALVTGYPFTSFGILHADSWTFLSFDLPADETVGEMIVNEVGEWWERHVVRDTPPPAPSYEDLKLPEVEGEIRQVTDPEWERAAREFAEANAILKEAQAIEKDARERLKDLHLDAGARIVEGAGIRTYLTTSDGRRQYAQELKAIASARPLDRARVQEVLLGKLGAERARPLLEELDAATLDLSAFEKVGDPFQTFRPYVLRGRE